MLKRVKWLVLLMAAVLMLFCAPGMAADAEGSLTVALGDMKQDVLDEGITLALYQIGAESSNGTWELEAPYQTSGLQEASSAREIQRAVEKIRTSVDQTNATAFATESNNGRNRIEFKGLKRGVYYCTAIDAPKYVTVQDFVISIPDSLDADGRMNVQASLKYSLQATPTPTPVPTPTPKPTPTQFVTPTPEPSPSTPPEEEETPTPTPTPTPTASPTPAPTTSLPPMSTLTPGPTPTLEPVITPSPTVTPMPSPTPEPHPYTITIYYIYEDGSKAWETYQGTMWPGEEYDVVSPVIPGYAANRDRIEGIMPARDLEFTVIYRPKKTSRKYLNIDEYDTPLGLGIIYMHVGVCYE